MRGSFLLLVVCGCAAEHGIPIPYEGTVSLDEADVRLEGEAVAGTIGRTVACVGDLNGDGFGDLAVGAPGAGPARAGVAYVFYGPTDSLTLSEVDAVIVGAGADDSFGVSISEAGDLNADGVGDLVVGAWEADPARFGRPLTDAGAAYVFWGPLHGELRADEADVIVHGERAGDALGFVLSGIEDFDADGIDDLAVTAFHAGSDSTGVAYLFYGPLAPGPRSAATADARLAGAELDDHLGLSIAPAGDMNGDGHPDVAIGAPLHDRGATDAGAAYVVAGPLEGSTDIAAASFLTLLGERVDDQAGSSVVGVGDVSGDGFDDLLVGAPLSDDPGERAGSAYVILGPASGTRNLRDADIRFVAENAGDLVGIAGTGATHLNRDRYADLVLGAWGLGRTGAAYVLYGPLGRGTYELVDAPARFLGQREGDGVGGSIAACDANGDSLDDVLLGAWGDDSSALNGGAVYLMFSSDGER